MSFLRRLSILTQGLRPSNRSSDTGDIEIYANSMDQYIIPVIANAPDIVVATDDTLTTMTTDGDTIVLTSNDRDRQIVVI